MNCAVCKENEAAGVACMPGMPVSSAYCVGCLKANAHPYDLLVVSTAEMGGLRNTNDGWVQMIRNTLDHLKLSDDQFLRDVQKEMGNAHTQ